MANKDHVSAVLDLMKWNGFKSYNPAKSKKKKITFPNIHVFLRQIWRRGYRQFHYEPAQCPNGPYWLALSQFPMGLTGRFILFEQSDAYAVYENLGRHIQLTKTPTDFQKTSF